jgi:hypothetical protein
VLPSFSKPSPVAARKVKTFTSAPWHDDAEGTKIVLYGKSGIGKTTLSAQIENAVFIGLDDGGRKIANPLTGKPITAISGIQSFEDIRDAIHQTNLIPEGGTLVLDNLTKLESFIEPYIFANYTAGSRGERVTNMRKYGWDGPAHVLDVFRLLLTDLDGLIRTGRNVVLLAQLGQITVANAEGSDYLEDGPKLVHNKQYSVRTDVCEWADHVFRIGYQTLQTAMDSDKAKVAKITSDDTSRAVFTSGAQYFIAKTRPIGGKWLPPVVSFGAPNDDSLWQMTFNGAIPDVTTA